jgi:transposase InsO family protein
VSAAPAQAEPLRERRSVRYFAAMASPARVHTARATVRTNVRSDCPQTTRRRADLTCGSVTATNSGTACDDNTRYDGDAWVDAPPLTGDLYTDSGSTYTAGVFTTLCRKLGVSQSMGRVGSSFDNAAAEAFFSTLEHEVLSRHHFTTKAHARQDVVA